MRHAINSDMVARVCHHPGLYRESEVLHVLAFLEEALDYVRLLEQSLGIEYGLTNRLVSLIEGLKENIRLLRERGLYPAKSAAHHE